MTISPPLCRRCMILVLELLPALFPQGIDLCSVLPLGAAVGRGPSTFLRPSSAPSSGSRTLCWSETV